jgi:hypothetical protein
MAALSADDWREELLAEFRAYLGRLPGTRPGQCLSASTINSYVTQYRNQLRGIQPTPASKPTHDSARVHWEHFLIWRDREIGLAMEAWQRFLESRREQPEGA